MGRWLPRNLSAEETAQTIERSLRWIRDRVDPDEIWLFGSAARGEMTEASDVDIALVFDSAEAMRAARRKLYSGPPPDDVPRDVAFFVRDDFLARAAVGGLPTIIHEDGVLVYDRIRECGCNSDTKCGRTCGDHRADLPTTADGRSI